MVGIEDLNLKGLLKHRTLARSFSDAALGKLHALLSSKVDMPEHTLCLLSRGPGS
jgi:putative transposase